MPWGTTGFDKDRYQVLMDKFGIRGIPTLVLLAKDGESAVSMKARGDISKGVGALA